MMNNLYYNYWSVSFSYGLFLIMINLFSLISVYTIGDKNDENNIFYSYFQFLKFGEFRYIFPPILSWIIIYCVKELFYLLALECLTPNHMMISY